MSQQYARYRPPGHESRWGRKVSVGCLIATTLVYASTAQAHLGEPIPSDIRPLLKRLCFACHASERVEGELDLSSFKSMLDVRQDLPTWQKVREMLDSRQMPPKDAHQPSDIERERLRQWVRGFLAKEAQARAGDPGPVVLRRLSNAEYNYSVRDLTGVDQLNPTREFPVDGAAGEGFTNVGAAQGMSPALVTKYLDAAKRVADHIVLLPGGIRFSRFNSRNDQTQELLARIQEFYRRHADEQGKTAVDLQGIKFDTNQGGRLPLRPYLLATLAHREALKSGRATITRVALDESLNAKYLGLLWQTLGESTDSTSLLIDAVRQQWKRSQPADVDVLLSLIEPAQQALWKFNPVGHIGRAGGPAAWMERVSTVVTRQELRLRLPKASAGNDVSMFLTAHNLGDDGSDFVVWQNPRIEFGEGRPSIRLRDVRALVQRIEKTQAVELPRTHLYLRAIATHHDSRQPLAELADDHQLNLDLLLKWWELIDPGSGREIQGHFTEKLVAINGYEMINGWGSPRTPSVVVNRSQEPVSYSTLTVPARGVTVHPSPTHESVVAWKSPVNSTVRVAGRVADADNKCGNGAAWRIELVTEFGTSVLQEGVIENGLEHDFEHDSALRVTPADVIRLVVNARDRNHACDTTHVALSITEEKGDHRSWDLAHDVVDRVLASNPLPDAYGNAQVWHFCACESPTRKASIIHADSMLARWRAAAWSRQPRDRIEMLGRQVQQLFHDESGESWRTVDAELRRRLLVWRGPLDWLNCTAEFPVDASSGYGLDAASFGRSQDDVTIDPQDLLIKAPRMIEVQLPAGLVGGAEFVATASLHPRLGEEGSVQVRASLTRPDRLGLSLSEPLLVGQATGRPAGRLKQAIEEFRLLFPPALCYTRIVPVDEVVTLTLYYREDEPLKRLMLDEEQSAELDRLWDEMLFVGEAPIALTAAYEQIAEFATQDRPDLVKSLAPMREPIFAGAEAFHQRLIRCESAHVQSLLSFAARAWRRPLTEVELQDLRDLYSQLRTDELSHREAMELTLAKILTSPAFLYKLETPGRGRRSSAVTHHELATRLSYFLWSSTPDEALFAAARSGNLADDRELLAQTRRMLMDERARRLAVQFACQWLHVRDFDRNDDKNEELYPEFATLREDMYAETVRFFADMIRQDGSVLEILTADHAHLNETLARHYGILGIEGDHWRRVDGVQQYGRGGVLGMATVLASQSGASRTSPILRGNWISETLLGERLPRPPPEVPQLPNEVPQGLTARQLIERHSSDPACAKCHAKIDPYGFALEQYDAIGRLRAAPVNTRTRLADGDEIDGINGLRQYLATVRRDDVLRHFCRKLLGYALGREVQLSDEPLLKEMRDRLTANQYRFSVAVQAIVTSRQFREIRGTGDEYPLGESSGE